MQAEIHPDNSRKYPLKFGHAEEDERTQKLLLRYIEQ